MNRDDILKMEAGPEMDLLVAPLVGWDNSHDYNECEDDWYTYCRNCGDEPRFSERENDCEVPPRYSTDIDAAWMVIEYMGNTYGWKPYNGVVIMRENKNWYVEFPRPNWEDAEAATAPLAICKAALLAVAGR